MFTHKEISHKVCRPTYSENAQHLFVWVYCEWCVHILCAFWVYYTLSVLILHCESFSLSTITPCHVLISQNVAHASELKGCACLMRTWLRFATKLKKFEAGISTWVFPLESPSIKWINHPQNISIYWYKHSGSFKTFWHDCHYNYIRNKYNNKDILPS